MILCVSFVHAIVSVACSIACITVGASAAGWSGAILAERSGFATGRWLKARIVTGRPDSCMRVLGN